MQVKTDFREKKLYSPPDSLTIHVISGHAEAQRKPGREEVAEMEA